MTATNEFLPTPEINKFSSVLIPIIFFVIFDLIALTLNFWISYRLSDNAVAINLSGRQRMLSQRMTKALQNINTPADLLDTTQNSEITEFRQAVELFDKTLNSFQYGGETLTGDHQPITIEPINSASTQRLLTSGLATWTAVKKDLSPLLTNKDVTDEQLKTAKSSLKLHNLQLLALMNKLTLALEINSNKEASYLRLCQLLVLIFALLNFIIICRRLLLNLRASEKNSNALHQIINSIDTALLIYGNNNCIHYGNTAAFNLFGYRSTELRKLTVDKLFRPTDSGYEASQKNGSVFPALISHQKMYDGNTEVTICTIIDITEQHKKEQALSRMAFYDALTQLPNRLLLMERLQQEILHATRNNHFVAVLFMDLDGFKAVNDNFGHKAGDSLLKMVSKRLIQCCRAYDTVARLGGDEFVIILSQTSSVEVIKKIAGKIIAQVQKSFYWNNNKLNIGASIGISIYPVNEGDIEQLLKNADEAMYKAKSRGKNQYCFYSEPTELGTQKHNHK